MGILDSIRKAWRGDEKKVARKFWRNTWGGEYGGNLERRDFSASDYGFAQAYAVVEAVRACVDIYADMIEQMPYDFIRNPTWDAGNDEIIASSTDIRPRIPVQGAFRRYRQAHNINLLRRVTYALMLYDVNYLELIRDEYGRSSDLKWLNPLGMMPQITSGVITGYWYSWDDANAKTWYLPEEVAYEHGFNPADDNRGLSIVLSIINELNIDQNLKQYLRDVFANNSRPSLVASFTNAEDAMNENLFDEVKRTFSQYLQGRGNQGKTLVSPVPLTIQTLDFPDLDRNDPIAHSIRTQVYAAFGVPMSMVGDTGSTRYKESMDARATFVQSKVKPLLLRIQEYLNDSVLKFFDPYGMTRIEFDTSSFDMLTEVDIQRANMVITDMQAGLITIGQAQEMRAYEVDKRIADWYLIEGIPVPPEALPQLWQSRFAQPAPTYPSEPESPPTVPIEYHELSVPEVEVTLKAEHVHSDACQHEHTLAYDALFAGDGLYPESATIAARQVDELAAWERFERKRAGKANKRTFEPRLLEGYVYHAALERIANGLGVIGTMEAVKTEAVYRSEVRQIAQRLYEGVLNVPMALEQFNRLIVEQFTEAYERGMERADVPVNSDTMAALEDDLQALIDTEQSYLPPLLDDIDLARQFGEPSLADIRLRLEGWVSRWSGVEERGYVMASQLGQDDSGVWAFGITRGKKLKWVRNLMKDSCEDCIDLDGKVYYASVWDKIGIYPRSSKLACFGEYCGCTLTETDDPLSQGAPLNKWENRV